MRCIAKGEEITQKYRAHFSEQPREQRQSILRRIFHFQCRCVACVNDYPLGDVLPRTYSEMTPLLLKNRTADSYVSEITEKIDNHCFLFQDSNSSKSIKDLLKTEIVSPLISQTQKIVNIFQILDEYNAAISEQLFHLIHEKNVEGALQLYCEGLRIVNIFLNPPHMFFLTGRMAITHCLWAKHGNKSYGAKKMPSFGNYMW